MSLKDNFNQALREVLHKDGIMKSPEEEKKKTELESYLEPPKKEKFEAEDNKRESENLTPEPESEPLPLSEDYSSIDIVPAAAKPAQESEAAKPDEQNVSPFTQYSQFARQSGAAARQETPQNSAYSGAYGSGQSFGASRAASQQFDPASQPRPQYGGAGTPPPTPPRPNRPSPFRGNEPDAPYYETEETTVISRNTIIDGNIRSFANINIDGSVKGDVTITKNISVTGKVVGDIECNNSVMSGASMQGNIMSKGQVQMDRDSLILGDISAQYLDLNGKIKGNVDVGGKAEFKTDAVILGNITASTITVLDGATIQGYVNTTFLQESSSSIFPEAIALSE